MVWFKYNTWKMKKGELGGEPLHNKIDDLKN
jgi:hypothetical protein